MGPTCTVTQPQAGGSGAGSTVDVVNLMDAIDATSGRLYKADFLGRAYLADYVANVGTLQNKLQELRAALEAAHRENVQRKSDQDYLLERLNEQLARVDRFLGDLTQARARIAALEGEHADSPTWSSVMDFAQEMERKLSLHRDRGNREGWLIETPRWLFERMLTEVEELGSALGVPIVISVGVKDEEPDGEEPGQECADVANLAMMLRDRLALDAGSQNREHPIPNQSDPIAQWVIGVDPAKPGADCTVTVEQPAP
jgi:hypothetical protein